MAPGHTETFSLEHSFMVKTFGLGGAWGGGPCNCCVTPVPIGVGFGFWTAFGFGFGLRGPDLGLGLDNI